MTLYGYCSVANGGCRAPAARAVGLGGPMYEEKEARVGLCSICRDEVCTEKNCSRLIGSRKGPSGRIRVCRNCEDEAASRVAPRKAAS